MILFNRSVFKNTKSVNGKLLRASFLAMSKLTKNPRLMSMESSFEREEKKRKNAIKEKMTAHRTQRSKM